MKETYKRSIIKFLGITGIAALSFLIPGERYSPSAIAQESLVSPTPAAQAHREINKTIYDISGFHDAPRIGGSVNLTEMETHLKAMGAKFVVGLLPSPPWYDAVKRIGATPIVRLNLPCNTFNKTIINEQLATVPKGTLVVPFNEPNLSGEVCWNPMLPEAAAENDFKAFRQIEAFGCIPMVTPISPGGNMEYENGDPVLDQDGFGYDEEKYFFLFMNRHAELGTFKRFPQAVMAMHAYDFRYYNPNLPPMWQRLRHFNDDFIRPIAGDIPIYITEGGFFLADVEQDKINQAEIGSAIEKFQGQNLNEVAGPNLADQLKSYNWWIYANFAQLLPSDNTSIRFERNAFFEQIDGQSRTNAEYDSMVRYHQTH